MDVMVIHCSIMPIEQRKGHNVRIYNRSQLPYTLDRDSHILQIKMIKIPLSRTVNLHSNVKLLQVG